MGVLASTNGSKKIVVFGLVVTNSQSVFAYEYIFQQWFELLEGSPEIVITDD